jgi:hypothetical protein
MKNILFTLIVFLFVPYLQRDFTFIIQIITRLSVELDRVAFATAKKIAHMSDNEKPIVASI